MSSALAELVWPDEGLTHFVIYDHPADEPDFYVLRGWRVTREELMPLPGALISHHLDDMRRAVQMLIPGLVCIPRSEQDDPEIVESWI